MSQVLESTPQEASAQLINVRSYGVWQGIDLLAFHENAILLDVKLRSQGVTVRHPIPDDDPPLPNDGLSCQLIRSFLDDFALVLSGHGGKENVAAVCMEKDEETRTITLRMSRNDGISEQKLSDLKQLVQLTMQDCGEGSLFFCLELMIWLC